MHIDTNQGRVTGRACGKCVCVCVRVDVWACMTCGGALRVCIRWRGDVRKGRACGRAARQGAGTGAVCLGRGRGGRVVCSETATPAGPGVEKRDPRDSKGLCGRSGVPFRFGPLVPRRLVGPPFLGIQAQAGGNVLETWAQAVGGAGVGGGGAAC